MKTKHLGKNNTKTPVGYKILDPIIRDRLSESHGIDIWNAYEFSYLDANKLPVLKVLEITIPSCSIAFCFAIIKRFYLLFYLISSCHHNVSSVNNFQFAVMYLK